MTLRNGLSEELNRQGNEHFSRGLYTDAYTCYAKALECDRLTGDQRALAATLGNLGNICNYTINEENAETIEQKMGISSAWTDLYKVVLNANIIIQKVF